MKPFSFAERLATAIVIVAFDLAIFVIPVTAFFAAYVILARPPWFRRWVAALYGDRPA